MMRPQDTPLSQSSMLYEDITKESWIVEMSQGHQSAALWSDEAGIMIGSYGMAEKEVMGFFGVLHQVLLATGPMCRDGNLLPNLIDLKKELRNSSVKKFLMIGIKLRIYR